MPFSSDLFSLEIQWNQVGGVYGITNVDRQMIYIGKTDDFKTRMSELAKDRNDCIHRYRPVFAYAEVIHEERARDNREAQLIAEYHPPCNNQKSDRRIASRRGGRVGVCDARGQFQHGGVEESDAAPRPS